MLENHDTTGFDEQQSEWTLDRCGQLLDTASASALTGQENYVILNIGNEPFGNGSSPVSSRPGPQQTAAAIQRLRNAGFEHTIMVDAPNWGQDWGFVMRDNAPTVLAADPTGNTIFSIHMYGVFDTAAEVNAYVDSFTSRNLALCICEFGDNHSDGNPDENAIMAKAQAPASAYMGWSWSGNGGGVEYLDMVIGFNPAQRSSLGHPVHHRRQRPVSTTSTEATIYSGGPTSTTNPLAPGHAGHTDRVERHQHVADAVLGRLHRHGDQLRDRALHRRDLHHLRLGRHLDHHVDQPTGLTANTTYRFQVRATQRRRERGLLGDHQRHHHEHHQPAAAGHPRHAQRRDVGRNHGQPDLGGVVGHGHQLPHRAMHRRDLHQLRADRHLDDHLVRQHRSGQRHDLPVTGCGR